MNFRTVGDLNAVINANLHKVPRDIDLVVGVPRSGMLAANLLCLYENLPLVDIDSFVKGELYSCGSTRVKEGWVKSVSEARKVLVVEDSCCSGNSVAEAQRKVQAAYPDKEYVFLAVFVMNESKKYVDIWLDVCPQPRMFEWNYLHHKGLENACFDIDGVLCLDPTEEQNDDGENYREFLRNAPVRVVPSFEIGYLITSRLEKYRADTEYWLKKNGIKYRELIMMQYATKEERIAHGDHGSFKGRHYKRIAGSYLFVESEPRQAEEIARISGKTVFCTGNQTVYTESSVTRAKREARSSVARMIPGPMKRAIKKVLGRG